MKKVPAEKLVAQLQDLLLQIAELPRTELARFLILKKRAARVLRRIKRDYPEQESFSVRGPSLSVRREGMGPAGGMMATPDMRPKKPPKLL